jgi:hypothetical protein
MIWFALVAGPLAWASRELVSYALVRPSCVIGSTQLLFVTAAVMLGLALSGALAGRVCLVRSRGARDDGGRPVDRNWFIASVAVGLDVLVAVLIILSVVSEFTLSPCE